MVESITITQAAEKIAHVLDINGCATAAERMRKDEYDIHINIGPEEYSIYAARIIITSRWSTYETRRLTYTVRVTWGSLTLPPEEADAAIAYYSRASNIARQICQVIDNENIVLPDSEEKIV